MEKCAATMPSVQSPGWLCNGAPLLKVGTVNVRGVPVVIRVDLADQLDGVWREIIQKEGLHPLPPGADHCHVVMKVPGRR